MKKLALIISSIVVLLTVIAVAVYANSQGIILLNPQGAVASHQRDLLVFASFLSLFGLIPTFILTAWIILRYSENRSTAGKKPQVSSAASLAWFALLATVIGVFIVVMLKSTFLIDPYKPLASDQPPLTVQVVAMQWKWLFIYPEYGIATVNELVIPQDRPIAFEITADAPMSSFWIPDLGGMIYAMEGMVTKLNLVANNTGEFTGRTAEINGKGYADMKFTTKAITPADFNRWITDTRSETRVLDWKAYQQLSKPTIAHPVEQFGLVDSSVYGNVLMKFMDPNQHGSTSHDQASH